MSVTPNNQSESDLERLVGARTAEQLLPSLATEALELPAAIRSALDEVTAPAAGYPERR